MGRNRQIKKPLWLADCKTWDGTQYSRNTDVASQLWARRSHLTSFISRCGSPSRGATTRSVPRVGSLLCISMVCDTINNKRSHDHKPANMTGSGFSMAAGPLANDVGGVVKEPRPSPCEAGHDIGVSPIPVF